MTERAKKRLFIAVDISDEARAVVARYVEELKKASRNVRVSWTKAENLHLTLKFLGDVEESRIAALASGVAKQAAALSTIDLEIGGTGVFPSPAKAKVLWVGVNNPDGSLANAAQRIDEVCEKLGFPREDRKFSPHLTIGRVR